MSENKQPPSMLQMYDWKKARMRSESNVILGLILLLTVLLASPIAKIASDLMFNKTALIIIGVVGLGIYFAVVKWRNQGVVTVYGLNMLGTVLLVVAALGLFAPDQTVEMLQSIPSQRIPLAILGVLLLAMGFGLRGVYLKREIAQAELERQQASATAEAAANDVEQPDDDTAS